MYHPICSFQDDFQEFEMIDDEDDDDEEEEDVDPDAPPSPSASPPLSPTLGTLKSRPTTLNLTTAVSQVSSLKLWTQTHTHVTDYVSCLVFVIVLYKYFKYLLLSLLIRILLTITAVCPQRKEAGRTLYARPHRVNAQSIIYIDLVMDNLFKSISVDGSSSEKL